MNDTLVSIIMPVYNAEEVVDRAIKSVLSQKYQNFELIVVDDGSTDRSHSILENYARRDSRVRLLTQSNMGPSAARNRALKEVTGSFLMFIDSDDVLHDDALQKAFDCINASKADVCIFAWNTIKEDKSSGYFFSIDECNTNKTDLFGKLFWYPYYCGGGNPWNKIWRVERIKVNDTITRFDEEISIYEDFLWCLENYDVVNNIVFLDDRLYDYYVYDSSISRDGDIIELREKYYKGAKTVCEYVMKNHPEVKEDVVVWYRHKVTALVFDKWINHQSIDEINELKQFPLYYMKHDRMGAWLKYIFMRSISAFVRK